MAGGWKLVVEICLPIPFVLLILLVIPAPRSFHRGVLALVDKTLGLTVFGTFSLLHIMLIVTLVCFLASVRATNNLLSQKPVDGDASPNVIAGHLGKRWRAGKRSFTNFCTLTKKFTPYEYAVALLLTREAVVERNFWISFICFTLWCLLARFFQIMKQKLRVEDELARLHKASGSASPEPAEAKKAK